MDNDKPTFLSSFGFNGVRRNEISVIGYAASLECDRSHFVQTGQWFPGVVETQLIYIRSVISLELRTDPSFRGG
jgi:hypothetical protein